MLWFNLPLVQFFLCSGVWSCMIINEYKTKEILYPGQIVPRVKKLNHNIHNIYWAASSQVTHTARAYPGFNSIKQLGIFLLPPGWGASLLQGTPLPPGQHYFASTHLYTWVERGTILIHNYDAEFRSAWIT